MARRFTMKKVYDNELVTIYPLTASNAVLMEDNVTTLQSAFSTLSNRLSTLQTNFDNLVALLNTEQVYVTENDEIVYDEDNDNTGLVAVY